MVKKAVAAVALIGISLALIGFVRGATAPRTALQQLPPNPVPVRLAPEPEAPPVLVEYDGPVEHIFFHPLVVYPELAFDGDFMAQGYDDWMVTVPEFQRIIASLYERDYILIGFDALFDVGSDGDLQRKPLRLPAGKKPLILSIDDLNYYEYMRDNGNAFRLIVDADGRVKTFSRTPQGEPVVSASNEIVPILDAFVDRHRDFSWQGAKGVIALTGYEGILGYRTDQLSAPGFEAEKREALKVVERLKATGWTFASHGWGHQDAQKVSGATLTRDTQRWKAEVESLIGPTPVYIYPFGSGPAPSDPKMRSMRELGFRIFCGVGPSPYLAMEDGMAFMDRRHIDGMAFRTQQQMLSPLFDARAVLDPVRPGR